MFLWGVAFSLLPIIIDIEPLGTSDHDLMQRTMFDHKPTPIAVESSFRLF